MKEKTFPLLLMQNNTFQLIKEIKVFFFYLNADKEKRKNINKSKPRVTLKLTHKKLKIGLSHLSKNPIKENFEGNF
jgi:hypothetical protein